jgi:ribonuclease BN (tRNA processing enzyme)
MMDPQRMGRFNAMSIKVIPLGINGFFPSFGRHTMSILVLVRGEVFLLDAGTGVARLSEPRIRELLGPYDCLNVLLSHYHLDHTMGLSYLSGVWKQGRVRIYAPGRPFVDADPDQILHQLLRPPFFPATLENFPIPIEVIPVRDEAVEIGRSLLRFRAQNHPDGSTGIRMGDRVAYVTDTTVEQSTETFVRGVNLLLHEVYLTDAEAEQDPRERSRHSYVSAVAELTRKVGGVRLMPIHHNPWRSDVDIRKMVEEMRDLSGLEVLVPEEGKVYELD